ncbi:MAG TPA: hypothetical protein VG755_14775 [Nannocystaceae bacterium]|nr:hypothetical protein [Nannocystaceae bacterium]
MKRSAIVLALASCTTTDLDPIRIDVSSNCNHVAVAPLISGIDGPNRPWDRVIAMAVDAPGLASGWMLVLRHADGGLDELAVLYLDATGVITVERTLGVPPGLAESFELVPAGQHGVAYLSQGLVGSFTLWRLDAGSPDPVRASSNLAPVPYFCDLEHLGDPQPCDSWMWEHRLMFVDGSPLLFTMPPASIDVQIDMWLVPFEWPTGGTMQLGSEIVLHFQPACGGAIEDEELCMALLDGLSFPHVSVIGAQRDARTPKSAIALYRELDDGTGLVTPELAVVELYSGDLGKTGNMTTQPGIPAPRPEGPTGVVQDQFASYIRYTAQDSEAVLAALPYRQDDSEPFVLLERDGLPIHDEHELVQLDDDIALHRIVDGDWELLKVFPDAPAQSEITRYSVPGEIVEVDSAGPATFLVRRDDGRADLVHVQCDAGTASDADVDED